LGYLGAQLGGHLSACYHQHPGVHGTIKIDRRTPTEQLVNRKGDLGEQEVGVALPGWQGR
jgi:hypothetical protein